ncbi:hypothetical protein IMSAG049_01525 [Clostridiales bacterium]|nr:hypothetical protein IMSAG049_01525 [Clostridiales bacterium]
MARRRIKRQIKIIILLVVVIGAIIFAVSFRAGLGNEITYGIDSRTACRTYGSGFIQYTRDGVAYYNSSGERVWNDTYTMTTPIAVERDDFTAIFETGGRSVRVYNKDGAIYNVQTSDMIQSVSLTENGYIGVISNGDTTTVSVYSLTGSLIFQRVEADDGVYPLCCDISPDGKIIAIGYIDTTGTKIKSKIGMFYIAANTETDNRDSMFTANEKDNEIIFKIYFVSKSRIIAVGDRHVYAISTTGMEEASAEVTNEIVGAGLCGNKIALIYGEELSDKDGEAPGTVVFVSSGGRLSTGASIGTVPDYFQCSSGGIVLGTGTAFYGISAGGSLAWTLNVMGNVTGIYPTSNINKCVYSTRTWSVIEDMRYFDASKYEPRTIPVTNTDNEESQDNDSTENGENTNDTEPAESEAGGEKPDENNENNENN